MSDVRRLAIYQDGELVGSLAVPASFRLPMSDGELAGIPGMLIARSRSWLLEVRASDFRLERRGDGAAEDLVIIAARSIMPGDFGLLVGFEPAEGNEHFAADEELVELADRLARQAKR